MQILKFPMLDYSATGKLLSLHCMNFFDARQSNQSSLNKSLIGSCSPFAMQMENGYFLFTFEHNNDKFPDIFIIEDIGSYHYFILKYYKGIFCTTYDQKDTFHVCDIKEFSMNIGMQNDNNSISILQTINIKANFINFSISLSGFGGFYLNYD